MSKNHMISRTDSAGSLGAVIVLLLVAAVVSFFVSCASAQSFKQRAFASPEDAVNALIRAAESENKEEMLAILGPGSDELVSSGDDVADKSGRALFTQAFEERNRIEKEEDSAVLYVGEDDWPLPIPIVNEDSRWRFDTEAGKDELLSRRIGRNELDVIEVVRAYVDAQRDYARKDRDGDTVAEYAQKFRSDEGKRNGLYWEIDSGEKPSPLGPLAAKAAKEGYQRQAAGEQPEPYHGYLYRILTGQGKNTPGGGFDYIVNGNMLFGFGLVAYPAEYGSSGIMTFIVNHQGVVYEKNLMEGTNKAVARMTVYDPDSTWNAVE